MRYNGATIATFLNLYHYLSMYGATMHQQELPIIKIITGRPAAPSDSQFTSLLLEACGQSQDTIQLVPTLHLIKFHLHQTAPR